MKKVHYQDNNGSDHIIKSASLMLPKDPEFNQNFGKIRVDFTCCSSLRYVTPEEFAMSYSVKPHSDGV
jgi:hypothetical protein